MPKTKLGLVLSGGGAKGAYEAGALKALAELNIQPDVIAGTSIGALNGAIDAAKRDTRQAANILEDLWLDLANSEALKIDKTKAVKNLIEVFTYFSPLPVTKLAKILTIAMKAGKSEEGLLTQTPIVDRLAKYAPVDALKTGLPFYVGMTKTKGNLQDIVNFAGFGNEDAVFKKIQDLSDEDMHKAIMASAALPWLFDSVEVEGEKYRDGCLGSTENEWGNTPAKPLIMEEKCTHLIVCHLNKGSFFNRYDPLFKDVTIIEIRPSSGTFSSGLDPLLFNVNKIETWMEQGYKDAGSIMRDAFVALRGRYEREQSEINAINAIGRLKKNNFSIPDK